MSRALRATILVLFLLAARDAAGRFIDLPYRDSKLLGAGRAKSTRVWLPNTAKGDRWYTMVVLLHGLNKAGRMYPLLDPKRVDVSRVATRLILSGKVRQRFILVAPTQIVGAAHSDTLWRHFDLPGFVEHVRRRLPRWLKLRDRVVVMGHSGAGCTPGSGLWWIARRYQPMVRAMATMDTCMDERFGEHLWQHLWPKPGRRRGKEPALGTWLINFWQPGWRRDPEGFERGLRMELLADRGPRGMRLIKRNSRRWLSAKIVLKRDAHRKIVDNVFTEALLRLFPTDATRRRLVRELRRAKRRHERLERARRRRGRRKAARR